MKNFPRPAPKKPKLLMPFVIVTGALLALFINAPAWAVTFWTSAAIVAIGAAKIFLR